MKKILALALAFVMVMGLASVAFAANDPEFTFRTGNNLVVNEGSKDEYKVANGDAVRIENEDGLLIKLVTDKQFEKGDTVYLGLKTINGEMDAKTANKWKVKADWRVGGDMVSDVSIVYKKALNANGKTYYDYWVAIETNA